MTPAFASDLADRTFVGRRREMAALRASLDVAAAGTGRLDIVSGPAGIGKTRLTHEIGAVARERGFYVLRGGCWEGEGAPAYWPWADVLRNHLGAAAGVPGSPADFSHLLEMAASQADVPVRAIIDASKDAQQARFMLFDRFCELLAVMARNQPLLVIVDDVQFADTGSLLLLQFLASRLSNVPLALLVTSREPLSELTASTARHPWARHRVLPGLSRSEARTLLAAYMPGTPRRSALDRLMHLTEGNPFFVKELGHLLTDGRRSSPPGEPTAWPVSLLAVTLQPYQRLSPACRALLQAASVVGREFDADVTAQAARVPTPDALLLLDEAVQHRVVAPIGPGRYHFVHALVREAIESQLHPSQRTGLHDSVALALERHSTEGQSIPAAVLAHHFCSALPSGTRRHAANYCIVAGEDALASFAYEEAVFQFRRAQSVSGPSLTQAESCDLLIHRGTAEAGAGQWAQSRRTFEDAADTARRINCPHRLARAALGFKGMMWGTNPVDTDAVLLLEEALLQLTDSAPELQVELLSALSRSLYFSTDTERAHGYSVEALDLAHRIGDQRLTANAIETKAVSLLRPGQSPEVLALAATLSDLGDTLRDPHLRFNAVMLQQFALITLGRITEADNQLSLAIRIADSSPYPRFRWQLALIRVARATLHGDLAAADRLSIVAQELGAKVHDASPTQYHLLQSFHRAQLRNDASSWATLSRSALSHLPNIPAIRIAHAWILSRTSHCELAIEALHALATDRFACIPSNHLTLYYLSVLSDIAVTLGQEAHSRTLYELLSPYSSEHIVTAWGSLVDGSTAHYLGLLATALHMPQLAEAHFQDAIEANRRIGAPALTARSALSLARLLITRGTSTDLDSATHLAKQCSGTFASLGLTHNAKQANEVHNEAQARIRRQGDPPIACSYVLRQHAEFWTLSFGSDSGSLRSTVGLSYVATLLSKPGEPIHVLDLVSDPGRSTQAPATPADTMSDVAARHSYKRRLKELLSELSDAQSNNDLGTYERLLTEQEGILHELSSAFGLSGVPRPSGSRAEKARISVRNRISSALRSIYRVSPTCSTFLQRSIKTGIFCVYDPIAPIPWEL